MGIWLVFRSMRRGIHIQHYGFTSGLPPAHLLPKHMALEQRAISYVTPPLLFNCFDRIHYANILSLSSCTSVTTQQWGSSGINIDLPYNLALRLWLFLRSENSGARTQTSPSLGKLRQEGIRAEAMTTTLPTSVKIKPFVYVALKFLTVFQCKTNMKNWMRNPIPHVRSLWRPVKPV